MNRDLRTLLSMKELLCQRGRLQGLQSLLLCLGLFGIVVSPLPAQLVPTEQVGSGSLTVRSGEFFEHAVLTVAGPEGYWLEMDFEAAEQVTADLLTQGRLVSRTQRDEPSSEPLVRLPDGSFRYELVAVDAEGEVHVSKGQFVMQGGVALTEPFVAGPRGSEPGDGAADETAGSAPGLQTRRSETLIADGILQVVNPGNADAVMSLAFNSPTIQNNVWNMSHESPAGDLHLEASGTLAPGSGATSLFIDRSSGAIGVNTSTPGASFELDVLGTSSGTSDLRLRSSFGSRLHLDSSVADFDLTSGIGNVPQFTVRDSLGADIFIVEEGAASNSLVVDATGNVGVGTNTPTSPFSVEGNAGLASIRVAEAGADAAVEVMFNLVCDCAPGFRMNNTNNGVTWFFRHTTPGDFAFDTPGSPGLEAQLTSAGNLTLKGQIFTASSRALKENLLPMDADSLLRSLDSLNLYEWSYLGESARHFGPMAEDFAQVYGLGRGPRKLAPSDVAGVALAGVKALRDEVQVLSRENSSLSEENDSLRTQLADIADRLRALESRD